MAEIARRAGWRQASSYQRYEDDTKFTRPYLPREIAEKLCDALVNTGSPPISVEDVMALAGEPAISFGRANILSRLVEVIAVVEAGAWREAVELPPEEREYFPLPPLPGFERMQVFGLRVRGTSMNEVFPHGSIVYFVRAEDMAPQEGNFVVVAAERGGLYETTLKELKRDRRGKLALWPRSTDPRHSGPIYVEKAGADTVEIIGVAVGKFEVIPVPSPIRR